MPRPRHAMRRVREVLRLALAEGLSARQIRNVTGIPRVTVARYLERAAVAGLTWPLPETMDDGDLEKRLFKPPGPAPAESRPMPDWAYVHREMRRPNVTLALLHIEHKEQHPDAHQYTQFCHYYRRWEKRLDVVMRHEHRAGEKLFVDFPGKKTIKITDPVTGEITVAELFVAVLGASNYIYAEALPSQELPHWISAHLNAFKFFNGCPAVLVPDNLKSAITKAHRYEPEVNASYQEMAEHFGCVVIPARPYKARDKAKVEVGVLIAERWLLARLRNRIFYSIAEANLAIRELLVWLNNRPFKKLPGSRQSWFEEIERPALRRLPASQYEFADWKEVTVSLDYHVEVDRHYYSVPYQLAHEACRARFTATTVEIFHRGRRVTSHLRSYVPYKHTTKREHMPASHRRHLEWSPGRMLNWARKAGPGTEELFGEIMRSRPHPEQGYRSCLGLMRLGRKYGNQRLEAACRRALAIRAFSSRSVQSILQTGLDRQPLPAPRPAPPVRHHANVRGAHYYQ